MGRASLVAAVGLWALATAAHANPYPDESAVPKVGASFFEAPVGPIGHRLDVRGLQNEGIPVLRVRVDWQRNGETYEIGAMVKELSGTPALLARARRPDPLGSYRGTLIDPETGAAIATDTIGTGKEFRLLTRALSFRFPMPEKPVELVVTGEHPVTGVMEELLRAMIDPAEVPDADVAVLPEVRLLRAATSDKKLLFNIYADGYSESRRERFFQDAARIPRALADAGLPGIEHLEFQAVFAPSNQTLGRARNLGMPVPERDSFLGLFFPYWHNFGRWYHVVYPTREERYRQALGSVPYDYPLALVDDGEYWGVGNYRELTAIPSRNGSFVYLLLHELGHFFGLNEEYESGGPTELAFAPEIEEPWSQNITFLRDPANLKWHEHVSPSTPIPTPSSRWSRNGPYGAYRGGYAETPPLGVSHKPGRACVMSSGASFCPICASAILERIRFDLGED